MMSAGREADPLKALKGGIKVKHSCLSAPCGCPIAVGVVLLLVRQIARRKRWKKWLSQHTQHIQHSERVSRMFKYKLGGEILADFLDFVTLLLL